MNIQITLFIAGEKEPITLTIDSNQTLYDLIIKIETLRNEIIKKEELTITSTELILQGIDKKQALVQFFIKNGNQLEQGNLSSSLESLGITPQNNTLYASTSPPFETRHNLSTKGIAKFLEHGAEPKGATENFDNVPAVLKAMVYDFLSEDPTAQAILGEQAQIDKYYDEQLNRLEAFVTHLPDDWEKYSMEEQNQYIEQKLPNASHLHALLPYFAKAEKDPKKITIKNLDPQSPRPVIIEAAEKGNIWLMALALKYGEDINANSTGWTPLIAGLSFSHFDFVKAVLNNPKTDCNAVNYNGDTPLMAFLKACGFPDLEMLNILIANPKTAVNHTNKDGETALTLACSRQQYTAVEFLLRRKDTDVNVLNNDLLTPLMIACKSGNNKNVQLLLTRKDTRVNIKGPQGTALHYAASKVDGSSPSDSADKVRSLLGFRGIDGSAINDTIKNNYGYTALSIATQLKFINTGLKFIKGFNEIVQVLEQHKKTKRSQLVNGYIHKIKMWASTPKQTKPEDDINQSYLNTVLEKAKLDEVEYKELGKMVNRVYISLEGTSIEDKLKLRDQFNKFFKKIHLEGPVADVNPQERLFIDHITLDELTSKFTKQMGATL